MTIPMTLREYLRACDIDYEEVSHPREVTTSRIAQISHIPGDQLAKAVMLHGKSGYGLAVVPSTHDTDLDSLTALFQERFEFASEGEISSSFDDCDPGAATPVGQAYGLKVYVDDMLRHQPDIYFEAGDHETLVHMSGREFERLMDGAPHGRFSHHR
ncbi:YbaK/EbsC family protein [Halomonas sp. ML-15]|uniref:aminoacyl-tRNA deacylase n=1 Tax=Halomonas sp. ML-15 TaxID=2773305 RepID=UPI001746F52A|nr:YbaK/EbsC family protein [Halomonas sp. ML-15]MBD3894987.1 YbaK/EbsC family protein [Halomonas sp. ML-15]